MTDFYKKDRIYTAHEAEKEAAEKRLPTYNDGSVKRATLTTQYIMQLCESYRKFYDKMPDEKLAQLKFNQKIAQIRDNVAREGFVAGV